MKKLFSKLGTVNKRYLPIIISLAICVVMLAGYFLLKLIPEISDLIDTPDDTSTPAKVGYLISEDYYTLTKIDIKQADSEPFSIICGNENGSRVFEISPAADGWLYKQDDLRATAFKAAAVSYLALVKENVKEKDFKDYGLDDPSLILETSFTDAESGTVKPHTLTFGSITALGDSYYAQIDDDPNVYAVSSYFYNAFSTTELRYRQLNFYPSYFDNETEKFDAKDFIDYLRVKDPSTGKDIEVNRHTTTEKLDNLLATEFFLSLPVEAECDDANVTDLLINVAVAFTIDSVVMDNPDEAALAEYGFDNAKELWLTNNDGKAIHYYIGDYNTGSAYIMVEGVDSILYSADFNPSFLDVTYVDVMFHSVWLYDIKTVDSIRFNYGDESHLLKILKNEQTESGSFDFSATLNGAFISENDSKRLYSRLLKLMIANEITDAPDISGETPLYKYTINQKDGASHSVELYAYNDRYYAASIDGAPPVYSIHVKYIAQISEAFEYISVGEPVPIQ